MKLFLDANVLFTAAHNLKGKSSFIIESAHSKRWTIITCTLAVEEAKRNLELKFPNCISDFERLFRNVKIVTTVIEGECPIVLPEKDRPIFLSAMHSKCTHLLTGDLRDFGKYMNQQKKSGGLVIQTVGDFLNSI